MKEPCVFVEADPKEPERAAAKVRHQRRSIMLLQRDDPGLPSACALLRHMEQNAALTALNRVISELSLPDVHATGPFDREDDGRLAAAGRGRRGHGGERRCVVVTRTLKGAWNRSLFVSPCLITGAIPRDFEAGRIGR